MNHLLDEIDRILFDDERNAIEKLRAIEELVRESRAALDQDD